MPFLFFANKNTARITSPTGGVGQTTAKYFSIQKNTASKNEKVV